MQRKFYIPFGEAPSQSIDYLLAIIYDARAVTLRLTEGISKEELHWQYAEGWNTIGALLSHIISCGHNFRTFFLEHRTFTKEEETKWIPGLEMGKYIPQLITDQPVEYYVEKMTEGTDMLIKAIKQLNEEDFHKKQAGYSDETGCNLAWVLYHLAEDKVHHRGQIGMIRKLYRHVNEIV